MEQQTNQHRVVVEDGLLKVFQFAERHLMVVNASPEGTEVNAVPYSSISPSLAATPILAATWAGDGHANVDFDCGAQRWNGIKPLDWIREGPSKAGFTADQVDGVFDEMRAAGEQSHCPRYER